MMVLDEKLEITKDQSYDKLSWMGAWISVKEIKKLQWMNYLCQEQSRWLTRRHRVMFRADKDCWRGHCWSGLCCVTLASPVDMAVLVIGLMARSPTHAVNVRDNIEYFGPGEQLGGKRLPAARTGTGFTFNLSPQCSPDAQPHRCYSGIHFTTLYITIFCRKRALHMATCWPTKRKWKINKWKKAHRWLLI